MALEYHLVRPIFGFWSDCGQVITLPAKAVLRTIISKNGMGLCTVMWDGRLVMAFSEDIAKNGISLEAVGNTAQPQHPLAARPASSNL